MAPLPVTRLKVSGRLKPALEMCEACGKAPSVVGCWKCGKALCAGCKDKKHVCRKPWGCSAPHHESDGGEPLWAGRSFGKGRR